MHAEFVTSLVNEREEYIQETQHTQQTATRTAHNQNIETTRVYIVIKKTQKTHIKKKHTFIKGTIGKPP